MIYFLTGRRYIYIFFPYQIPNTVFFWVYYLESNPVSFLTHSFSVLNWVGSSTFEMLLRYRDFYFSQSFHWLSSSILWYTYPQVFHSQTYFLSYTVSSFPHGNFTSMVSSSSQKWLGFTLGYHKTIILGLFSTYLTSSSIGSVYLFS